MRCHIKHKCVGFPVRHKEDIKKIILSRARGTVVEWLKQTTCCKRSPEVIRMCLSTRLGLLFVFGRRAALLAPFPCSGEHLVRSGCIRVP